MTTFPRNFPACCPLDLVPGGPAGLPTPAFAPVAESGRGYGTEGRTARHPVLRQSIRLGMRTRFFPGCGTVGRWQQRRGLLVGRRLRRPPPVAEPLDDVEED